MASPISCSSKHVMLESSSMMQTCLIKRTKGLQKLTTACSRQGLTIAWGCSL